MNALLASARQLVRDLIDKRLWPVAVVLLAALVAAPMLIGGGDTAAPAVPAAGAVAVAPGAAAPAPPHAVANAAGAEAASEPKPVKAERGGKLDDPFFDPPKPPEASGPAGAADAAGGATTAVARSPTGEAAPRPGTSSAASPKAERPATAKPAPKPAATPRPATRAPAVTTAPGSYLRTVVRVNGGKRHPISRLTPLGGSAHPAALFLGIAKAKARYAVFVLGPRAISRGEATCKGGTDCRMIGLKAGQTQIVTVRLASGAVRRYRLRVESIRKVVAPAARARTARAHVHTDGRRVLRVMRRDAATHTALRAARYDARAGLLRAAGADAVKSASE